MCTRVYVSIDMCVLGCHISAGKVAGGDGSKESFEFEPLAQLIRRVREKAWLSPSRERKESFSMSPWICGCFS